MSDFDGAKFDENVKAIGDWAREMNSACDKLIANYERQGKIFDELRLSLRTARGE